ncbi:REP-associated tyrosine transposase [Luteimonas lutimaris]|uniref:Transposase n=1 Tax=Luteimonas lutimaris TaxID=698645 RepID=A0ABP7MAH6_9GAMM
MERPRSHALRRGRWSETGRIYLVTFVAAQREALFTEWKTAAPVARGLSAPDAWLDSNLLCWVLMPDHWHGLVELGAGESLSRNVGRAKAAACRAWTRESDRATSPWQPGFHDRALRSEDQAVDAARYIVANPIRAKLVRRLVDYPYWDAVWL